ncbi:MAG: serine hydrolase [Pirellulaceae bacterium]|nr:serine hydrolase [Pirellulaceae bacterium]
MLRLFKNLVASGRTSSRKRSHRNARRNTLSIESLENRQVMSGSPLAADADQSLTTPTAWYWYHGVSAATVSQKLTENNGRLIDIEIENASPLRFTVAMVKNSGDYGHAWWWYFGQTKAQLEAKITLHNARIQDLQVYTVNGATRYAAILTPNTGEATKSWWWYHGISPATLSTKIQENQARIIDLDSRVVNGTRVYDAVMVRNSGVDQKQWWYYYNRTPAQITTLIAEKGARIIDIEQRTPTTFDVVMVKNDARDNWWWYHGKTSEQVNELISQKASRIVDIETYEIAGQKRFAVAMIDNANDVTSDVRAALSSVTTTGEVGAYLKEVGGGVVTNLQGERKFEPASMIKALIHLHTMRRLNAGDRRADLNRLYDFYYKPGDNINNNLKGNPDVNPDSYLNTSTNRITENLGKILERMMERSDNRATKTINDLFGDIAINATALAAGMTNTVLTSTLGSGIAGNFMTLADAGKLYEGVLNGTLLGTGTNAQTQFFRLMSDENATDEEQFNNGHDGINDTIRNIVVDEARLRLGKSIVDTAVITLANSFLDKMRRGSKGGSYTISHSPTEWRQTRTTGGWIEVPTNGGLSSRRFVYGAFVEHAITPKVPESNPALTKVENAVGDATSIMLRSVIKSAMQTW